MQSWEDLVNLKAIRKKYATNEIHDSIGCYCEFDNLIKYVRDVKSTLFKLYKEKNTSNQMFISKSGDKRTETSTTMWSTLNHGMIIYLKQSQINTVYSTEMKNRIRCTFEQLLHSAAPFMFMDM